jgi:hypothetical protein
VSEGSWFWVGFMTAYFAVGIYVWALAMREKWMFYKWRGLFVIAFMLFGFPHTSPTG